jgi:NAD(P)-dependent dehydrogenase (short-subunit alcohol dehydrogenase family)
MAERATLVIGASKGLGRSCVTALARSGEERIVGTYHLDRDGLLATRDDAAQFGTEVEPVQVGLSDLSSIAELRDAIAARGWKVHKLVHSASTGKWLPLTAVNARSLRRVLEVMGLGLITLTRTFRRDLIDTEGAIVGISSAGSLRAIPFYGAIGMAKAALEASTRYLAGELSPYGVRVNCVRPGIYESASLRASPMPQAMRDHYRTHNALKTDLPIEDVANVITWLLSEDASTISGQVINVDAGFSITFV